MRKGIAYLLPALFLAFAAAGAAYAVEPDEMLDDPALEERARDISQHLRCVVCKNQNIDESTAPLARDLRILIRERLEEGDSNKEVVAFVVDRYGDFVLLTPPIKTGTLPLWLAPALLLIGGGLIVAYYFRVVLKKPKRKGTK